MDSSLRSWTFRIVALAIVAASGAAAEQPPSSLAFRQLASLVGKWKGVHAGTEVQLIYSLTADGSVLMEEFRPTNGPTMVTMFSVDGDHLIATHYCSAGNQPQMATAAITEPLAKSLAFSLVGVTGMKSPDDWHNTELVVTLDDSEHLTQEWTYRHKTDTGKNVFRFTRVREGAGR